MLLVWEGHGIQIGEEEDEKILGKSLDDTLLLEDFFGPQHFATELL